MNKTHSFSTKTVEDLTFVSNTKKKYRDKGLNFSWVVLQALKEYEANKSKEHAIRRKN